MVNNNKRSGVITVSPWFSVCVDSFIIASHSSTTNNKCFYSILVMKLESIRCPSTVLRKQLSVWSTPEIVALWGSQWWASTTQKVV